VWNNIDAETATCYGVVHTVATLTVVYHQAAHQRKVAKGAKKKMAKARGESISEIIVNIMASAWHRRRRQHHGICVKKHEKRKRHRYQYISMAKAVRNTDMAAIASWRIV